MKCRHNAVVVEYSTALIIQAGDCPLYCFLQVAIKVPLERTLHHELEMLRTLRGLRGVPSLASDTLVQGAIVSAPVLQPLTLAVIRRARLHLAVPALVSTFKVIVCKHAAVLCVYTSVDHLVPLWLWKASSPSGLHTLYCTCCSSANLKRFATLSLCWLTGGA